MISRTVFMSVSAQYDNLGDIVIRDAAVALLSGSGRKFFIYSGVMPEDYLQAFTFPEGTKLTNSKKEFASGLLRSVFSRHADLVFAPGPLVLRNDAKTVLKSFARLGLTALVRMFGGKVYALGIGWAGRNRFAEPIERLRVRISNRYICRDTASVNLLGNKVELLPDLGFYRFQTQPDRERRIVAISLRYDKSWPEAFMARLLDSCRSKGLEPVFLTQVARDHTQHERLANSFDARHIGWADGVAGHRNQLTKVNEIYAQSSAVVSDRLHALVLGMNNGARPVALIQGKGQKLRSTLGWLVNPIEIVVPNWDESNFSSASDQTMVKAGRASSELQRLAEQLALFGES